MTKYPTKTKRSPREACFMDEYMIDLNGTAAAIRAGYSEKRAKVTACLLLKRSDIRAEVDRRLSARAEKTGITAERVLKETELISFSDIEHYMLDDSGTLVAAPGAPAGAMRAIASIKYRNVTTGSGERARTERSCEFRLWNKPEVLKLSGRHVGLKGFADRLELTGKDGEPIEAVTEVTVTFVRPDEAT